MLKGFAAVVVGGSTMFAARPSPASCSVSSRSSSLRYISTACRDGFTYGLLLLFLVVRPRGLFGSANFMRA